MKHGRSCMRHRNMMTLSKERDRSRSSLVTSCRPPGRLQKRPDDRTWNAGVAVRTADGSRRTADAGDERCLRCGCSSASCTVVWCYLPPGRCWRRAMSEVWMQQSVIYCGAVCCRRRWTVAHSLYCSRRGTSSQCSSSCTRRLSPAAALRYVMYFRSYE